MVPRRKDREYNTKSMLITANQGVKLLDLILQWFLNEDSVVNFSKELDEGNISRVSELHNLPYMC
jgi:hypothetical protein